jgi:hypothetical protein
VSDDGVVLDVVFEAGLLHLELINLGARPALDVRCSFDPQLVDAHGRNVSELRLFRGLALLVPGRRIRILLGPSSDYSTSVTVVVEYSYADGERQTSRITHDLAAFAELIYVV